MRWEKVARQERTHFIPSQRSQPATQKQLNYILVLAREKGQSKPKLPKTKKGASNLIERLIVLPDIQAQYIPAQSEQAEPEAPPNKHQELVTELRERFPKLSPMTTNSLVQLFSQVDEVGMCFVLDSLMQEQVPQDPDALILHILRRFLSEFAPINSDDPELVPG